MNEKYKQKRPRRRIIMSDLILNSRKDLFVLEDENNPKTTESTIIYPKSIIDQIFDPETPTNKNLREILKEMRLQIMACGIDSIVFPVRSVNRLTGDIILTKNNIGLGQVDNTADNEKPLSGPQRNAIMDILGSYNFKVNMNPLYDHLSDMNNPHDVTVTQLDKDSKLTNFIQDLINRHCLDTGKFVHLDIRNSLARLWDYTEKTITREVLPGVKEMRQDLNAHMEDEVAHSSLFDKKEDLVNKASKITDDSTTHKNYPTTRALVDYVTKQFSNYSETHPTIDNYIGTISVIHAKEDLPRPSIDVIRNAYWIQYADQAQSAIALCRENAGSYSWDIQTVGAISSFNEEQFENGPDGLSIKMEHVVDTLLGRTGDVHQITKNLLKDYYTRDEATSNFIQNITILPGTMDGHIRYYMNNDMSTMSPEVEIPGLKTLAFLEKISEHELREQAVHNRHILSKAVDQRCIADGAIHKEHLALDADLVEMMRAPKGSIIGNIRYDNGMCHAIPIQDFIDLITGGVLTVPGINAPVMEVCYNQWVLNSEIPFPDGSFGYRFHGTIDSIPNVQVATPLSMEFTSRKYQLLNSGGWWRTDTNNETDQNISTSSALTGATSEIKINKHGLYFVTVSNAQRIGAEYDVWIRYKKKEV